MAIVEHSMNLISECIEKQGELDLRFIFRNTTSIILMFDPSWLDCSSSSFFFLVQLVSSFEEGKITMVKSAWRKLLYSPLEKWWAFILAILKFISDCSMKRTMERNSSNQVSFRTTILRHWITIVWSNLIMFLIFGNDHSNILQELGNLYRLNLVINDRLWWTLNACWKSYHVREYSHRFTQSYRGVHGEKGANLFKAVKQNNRGTRSAKSTSKSTTCWYLANRALGI